MANFKLYSCESYENIVFPFMTLKKPTQNTVVKILANTCKETTLNIKYYTAWKTEKIIPLCIFIQSNCHRQVDVDHKRMKSLPNTQFK